ncbi:hypothetical protein PAPYR_4226 [Paratrimastix pyriformis]|uniref:Uncharacterized protein n=1 Tax=Paratrimastix pyriformis TaxID=342808 RepID=A0ABQ8UKU3_9EUKA|nr:hypothetical protein PAPYR_4226 [Paratrimastix pyriformis]
MKSQVLDHLQHPEPCSCSCSTHPVPSSSSSSSSSAGGGTDGAECLLDETQLHWRRSGMRGLRGVLALPHRVDVFPVGPASAATSPSPSRSSSSDLDVDRATLAAAAAASAPGLKKKPETTGTGNPFKRLLHTGSMSRRASQTLVAPASMTDPHQALSSVLPHLLSVLRQRLHQVAGTVSISEVTYSRGARPLARFVAQPSDGSECHPALFHLTPGRSRGFLMCGPAVPTPTDDEPTCFTIRGWDSALRPFAISLPPCVVLPSALGAAPTLACSLLRAAVPHMITPTSLPEAFIVDTPDLPMPPCAYLRGAGGLAVCLPATTSPHPADGVVSLSSASAAATASPTEMITERLQRALGTPSDESLLGELHALEQDLDAATERQMAHLGAGKQQQDGGRDPTSPPPPIEQVQVPHLRLVSLLSRSLARAQAAAAAAAVSHPASAPSSPSPSSPAGAAAGTAAPTPAPFAESPVALARLNDLLSDCLEAPTPAPYPVAAPLTRPCLDHATMTLALAQRHVGCWRWGLDLIQQLRLACHALGAAGHMDTITMSALERLLREAAPAPLFAEAAHSTELLGVVLGFDPQSPPAMLALALWGTALALAAISLLGRAIPGEHPLLAQEWSVVAGKSGAMFDRCLPVAIVGGSVERGTFLRTMMMQAERALQWLVEGGGPSSPGGSPVAAKFAERPSK